MPKNINNPMRWCIYPSCPFLAKSLRELEQHAVEQHHARPAQPKVNGKVEQSTLFDPTEYVGRRGSIYGFVRSA